MKFQKAEPEQGFFKISMYGPSGAGKTFTSFLMSEKLAGIQSKRIALIDTENGYHHYVQDVKQRKVHPEGFDVDVFHTTSMIEALDAVKAIDPNEYGVVIVDQISTLWDAMQNAVPDDKKTKAGTIPMHLWGSIKKPYKAFIRELVNGQYHTFVLGRQRNVFEDADGQLKKVGVEMKAEGETAYEFNMCIRMAAKQSEKDSALTTYLAIFEKDRSGILAGRTFPNPSFKTIEPVLTLLNGHHVIADDPEDSAEKDAELFQREAEKKKDKENKSRDLFNKFNAEITTCEELPVLADIFNKIKKQKRYMVETHIKSLWEIYNSRRDRLTREVAPVSE